MGGDLVSNCDNFREEFEDYLLATDLQDKANEVQAATLRRVMGNECRHIYKHNPGLSAEQGKDPKVILDALEEYFKPARNVKFERYMFGREKAASCEYGQLRGSDKRQIGAGCKR